MKIVYVAGKFAGPTAWAIEQNVRAAESVAYQVVQAGAMPFTPHANTRLFYGIASEQFFYQGTLELLRRCDAVILVPGWESSKGAVAERAEAELKKIPVFTELAQLYAWLKETT